MKNFNYKKLLMALAIAVIVQSGTVVAYNTADGAGAYSEEEGAAPCSDRPYQDDTHTWHNFSL